MSCPSAAVRQAFRLADNLNCNTPDWERVSSPSFTARILQNLPLPARGRVTPRSMRISRFIRPPAHGFRLLPQVLQAGANRGQLGCDRTIKRAE